MPDLRTRPHRGYVRISEQILPMARRKPTGMLSYCNEFQSSPSAKFTKKDVRRFLCRQVLIVFVFAIFDSVIISEPKIDRWILSLFMCFLIAAFLLGLDIIYREIPQRSIY